MIVSLPIPEKAPCSSLVPLGKAENPLLFVAPALGVFQYVVPVVFK